MRLEIRSSGGGGDQEVPALSSLRYTGTFLDDVSLMLAEITRGHLSLKGQTNGQFRLYQQLDRLPLSTSG
jgi:hypothetical protein